MNRLVLLDPGLITPLSHNYSEANALVSEAHNLGLEVEVYGHVEAHRAVREIPARPYFRQHGYGHMAQSRPAADFMAIDHCTRATRGDLEGLSPKLSANDFVFFPTVTCNQVLAVCQWISTFSPDRTPRFGICLLFPPDTNAGGHPSAVALQTYRQAIARIPSELNEGIAWTSEIDSISEAYEPLLKQRPLTLPIPTRALQEEPRGRAPEELRLAFLGGARAEKGFHLLPDAIERIRSRHPDISVTVQTIGYEAEWVQQTADRLAALGTSITRIPTPLSDEALMAEMKRASLLLLPYDPARYRVRGSSLFSEAKRLGVPMVLPRGTAIGDEGERKGIAELFERFAADDVAEAVLRAVERLEILSQAAIREAAAEQAKPMGYLSVLLRRLGCAV